MKPRHGSTLVEVLVAIFVMGIGLIALLTLFPIGALRMARSIHNSRSAQAGQIAHAIAIAQNIRQDPSVVSEVPTGGTSQDLFKNPYQAGLPDAPPYGESYAIFVDPFGYTQGGAGVPAGDWVAGQVGLLRRRPVGFVNAGSVPLTNLNIYRSFTLWDDINFDKTINPGTPQKVANAIFRDAHFSWGYMLRRPMTSETSIVDCSVVVFDSRPLSLNANLTLSETVYPATYFDPVKNTITIDYTATGVPPSIRPGNWILDATILNPPTAAGAQHAYFYRVVAVQDLANTIVQYEVQNPIRGFGSPNPVALAANGFGYPGTSIVMEGIAEVFEKGPGRVP